jgi:putative ABC transport system permease protein
VVGDLLGQFGSTSLIVAPNISAIRESKGTLRFEEITRDDIETINSEAKAVSAVTPQVQMEASFRAGEATAKATLFGTMHQYLQASRLTLQRGRFIDADDDTYMRKVGVLGHDLAATLFGAENPVGRFVRVNSIVEVEIVGVLEKEEKSFISTVSDFDTSNNNRLFVPSSAIERVGGSSQVFFLVGEAVAADRVEDAKQQILAVLDRNHGLWNGQVHKYIVQEMGQVIAMIDTATGTLTAAISIVAGIALLVAGIGIMNIMLVSVKERTREIGVRRALGARRSTILMQFLLEAVAVSMVGGVAGTLLGISVAWFLSMVSPIEAAVSAEVVLLGAGFSVATGLLFGIWPAWSAAALHPIEALRYE